MDQKLRNKAVKLVAAELSGDAALALDTFDKFSESELITLCYQSQYPLLHLVLQQALGIAEAIALKEQTKSKPHPIMKLAFEHANVLELCFKNEKMITLFTSPNAICIQKLCKMKSIDFYSHLKHMLFLKLGHLQVYLRKVVSSLQ